jgi:hypothetical protein
MFKGWRRKREGRERKAELHEEGDMAVGDRGWEPGKRRENGPYLSELTLASVPGFCFKAREGEFEKT